MTVCGKVIQKVEQPTVHVTLTVIGACVQDDVTELLLSDDSVRAISSQLLMAALPQELEEDFRIFLCRAKNKLKAAIKRIGSTFSETSVNCYTYT
ncbi:hypothetical protein DPMN_054311 [Dreissena polymorpha]|uniref:Uncharacterized protein n=1 Tax=Dreissena polymorpha TaxID=45954 RepID=A0A9D4CNN9_DREPO|nr:hypothetical protein DPMN_054311 [Dreissena polymorpha]